jgi:hypothetical protein
MEQFSSERSQSGPKENGELERKSNAPGPEENRQQAIKRWERFRDFGMQGLKPDGQPLLPAVDKEGRNRVNKLILLSSLRDAVDILRDRASQPKKPDRVMNDPKDTLFAKYKGYTQREFPDGEILLPSGAKLAVESVVMLQSPFLRRDGRESSIYRQGAFILTKNGSKLEIVINNTEWHVSVDENEVDRSDNEVTKDVVDALMAVVKELPPLPDISEQKAEEKQRTREALKKLRFGEEQGKQ